MSTIGGRLLGVTLAALLTIGCGCGSTTAGMGTALAPVAGGVTVVVQNQNFADVDVFVVRDGAVVTRLGMVNGESTARFPIDPSLFPTGSLSLVARPIGGSGVARSGPVLVNGGQTVTFTIQPELAASMATVR